MYTQSQNPLRSPRPRRAYTLLEMLMVILIIQVISSFVLVSVSTVTTQSKLDLINKRALGLLRYARMLAMSSGQPVNVDFNLTTQTIKVYLGASTTPVNNPLFPGGECAVNLATGQGTSGATITAVSNAPLVNAAGVNPVIYRCTYGTLGTRSNAPSFTDPMTVTFTYGSTPATLTIPNAGDAF